MRHYENEVSTMFPAHPKYDEYVGVWEMIDDCLAGSTAVKDRSVTYLPKTEGMASDPVMGDVIYKRYLHGALYPEHAQDFFIASTGLLKQKDPLVNFPDVMHKEFIPAPAYDSDKSFYDVYSEVQDGVMKYSRCGVLLDPPDTYEKKLHKFPLMSIYNTYKIINWGYSQYKGRRVLSWILLDESYYETTGENFSSQLKDKYRFLGLKTKDDAGHDLDSPLYYTYTGETNIRSIFNPPMPNSDGVILDSVSGVVITYPNINGKYLDRIPFFCFTGTRISLEPERPIVQSLCEACIYIYNLSADYKEYLYKQGFGIMFGRGFETDQTIYTGTNKAIIVASPDADLKMVESSGNGLAEYRLAVSNAIDYAKSLGLAILKGNGDETGVSVAKRQGFKTASLKSISKTVGEGFTQIAKTAAEWAGLSEDEISNISISPNTDFSATALSSDITVFQNVLNSDYPIMSDWDIYHNLRNLGKTVYGTFEEYQAEVDATRKARDAYKLQLKIEETEKMNELQLKQQQAMQKLQAVTPTANNPSDASVGSDGGGKEEAPPAQKASEGDMSKAVVCIETGKRYNSATEAGKDVGVSGSAITRAANGTSKTAGTLNNRPLHWKYA